MASPSGKSGLRLYGVIDAEAADPAMLEEQHVRLVKYRDLAAVVAGAPYTRVAPTDADVKDYLRVVDAFSAHGPMVPAPPATVFRDDAVLARWLDVHYAKLHEAMAIIEQREDDSPPYDYIRMELGG